MNPGSGNGGYYAQHGNSHPGNQMQSGPSFQNQPMHQMPSHVHQHPHQHHASLVSTGPALQYYTPSSNGIQVPISNAGGHLRQPAQFYPVSHMSLHHNGHAMNGGMSLNSSQGQPTGGHPHVAVMSASGHPSHGHHLVAIPTGNPNQNGQPMMLQSSAGVAGGNNQLGHPGHPMNMGRGPNGQPQVLFVCIK